MSSQIDTSAWLKDGSTQGWLSGQDGSRNAADIQKDQYSSGVNVTCRGGNITPRPGLIRRPLTYETDTAAKFFQRGVFQLGSFYDGNGTPALLSSQSGRQFKIDIATWTVTDITPQSSLTVQTTANFTVPVAGSNVAILVTDTSAFYSELTSIQVGGNTLVLISIDSTTQITVQNTIASQAGNFVAFPASLLYYSFDINSPTKKIGWSLQALNYWIYQDNQSRPIIFDGSTSRRSSAAADEVPVGNVMAFAMGRIVVALPDRSSFRAGDLIYGASGTAANGYRDAILKFTENNYLNEGGDFVARIFGSPSYSGVITCMKTAAMPDTQLGQGPLIVGTPNMVFTVQLPFDRTTWKNLQQPLQTVIPIKGPLGQNSTVQINTDLWYRANDNSIRSYLLAQRDFQSLGNTGQSAELDDILEQDTEFLLENGYAVLFNNRLLMTISPADSPSGVYHRGLVSLDFNLVSTIRQKAPPAWEGIWTGISPMAIVTGIVNGKERCFIYARNSNGHIELWELDEDTKTDDGQRITCIVELPAYNFGDSDQYKRLEYGRFIIENLTGTLDWNVQYRTDLSPCYTPWDNGTVCAKNQDCGPYACVGPVTYRTQVRTPIKLRTPPDDTFDPITRHLYRCGFEFQPMVTFTGWAEFRQWRIYSRPESEIISREETDQ